MGRALVGKEGSTRSSIQVLTDHTWPLFSNKARDKPLLFFLCSAGSKKQLTSGTAGLTKAHISEMNTLISN